MLETKITYKTNYEGKLLSQVRVGSLEMYILQSGVRRTG